MSATHRLVVDRPGERLDVFLSRALPELSRSRLQRLIAQGLVSLEGRPAKAGAKTRLGQAAVVVVPPPEPSELTPEELDLEVVFEDEHLLVVNKPAGLVVHPGPGHRGGTLVHGLLARCPDLKGIGGQERPGIIHRLDKDTSGLLVVAKTDLAHRRLSQAFKDRRVTKTYLAVLLGRPAWGEKEVDAPIGRHPAQRKRMAVLPSGRPALSRFRVRASLAGPLTLVEVDLLTGRTHQIRVHAAHLGHPVLGDPVYGDRRREKLLTGQARELASTLLGQALHAWRLSFEHPCREVALRFEAALPPSLNRLVEPSGPCSSSV